MVKLDTKIRNLQFELDKVERGYCISFKLLNYDELNAMMAKDIHIIDKLNKIISEICNELISNSVTSIYKHIEHDRILLVLPILDPNLVKEIALKAHLLSQLYVDDLLPTVYMNCSIASIEFPKFSNKAEEIYNLLNWLISYPGDQNYYREYDSKYYNIEYIKESNKQLNLLRKSLLNKTMVFAYQPVIDSKTMKAHYYECLLRVPDTNNYLCSVGAIIPEAEKKGLIFIVDQVVLEMAIKELNANPDLTLAVNISNIGTLDAPLLVIAEKLLQTYDVSGRLIIEITETSLNQHYQQITYFMHRLRKYGCKFALDDFGSGFTSFKQLQNLPIDIIKIDGSYVRNITSDLQSQDFIKRLINLSEDLGIQTVAEFVENGKIAKFLINLKIDAMQGDFFSPASVNRIK
ncbi:EAL domain-containing protein [Candidatus Tisiphia endosymbiont of Mystacides longicornis]|uniref:EAL domain-containing protein n=1 Tax=Candidatus Tisiphia endosymbiont of Mystacides longicornis TaxID=3139330 RepID=UPI003CCAB05E